MKTSLSRSLTVFASVGVAMLAFTGLADAAERSTRSKFVDGCLKRVEEHDPKVASDCYTADYVLWGGPETYAAPGRKLIGRNAVRAKMVMGKGDYDAWQSIDMVWTDLAESGNTLVRHLHQQFKGPRVSNYAGFTDLPRDLSFPVDVIIVYTFKDGKIASEFFQYDSMGFLMDLAQGDPQKIAAALEGMKPFMEYMKQHGAVPEGLPTTAAPQK